MKLLYILIVLLLVSCLINYDKVLTIFLCFCSIISIAFITIYTAKPQIKYKKT